jgi:hypothetical protein
MKKIFFRMHRSFGLCENGIKKRMQDTHKFLASRNRIEKIENMVERKDRL